MTSNIVNINKIEEQAEQLNELIFKTKYEKQAIQASIDNLTKQKDDLSNEIELLRKSIAITQNYAETIKKNIIGQFENLVTQGLSEVFGMNYKFNIEYSTHGSSLVVDFIITLPNGKKINLSTGEGGGLKDFASVLQRILYLMLDPSNPDKILFLDENLKHLDKERAKKAIVFLKKLTQELRIQVLFITHYSGIKEIINDEDINLISLS